MTDEAPTLEETTTYQEAPAEENLQGTKRPLDEETDDAVAKKARVETNGDALAGEVEAAPAAETAYDAAAGAAYQAAYAYAVEAPAAPEEPPVPQNPPPGYDKGIVKWFDLTKGYGFIQREPGQDDVFVHQTSLAPKPGFKGLQDKEEVWFRITVEDSGRLRANDITGPGGKPVIGVSEYPVAGAMGQQPQVQRPLPPHTTDPLPPGKIRGSCKWFNINKGYGFLTPEDNSEDIFIHQSNLLCEPGAFRSLAEGECVEFEIMDEPNQGRAKRKAQNCTGPGGKPVVGVPRPMPQQAQNPMMNPMMGAYGYGYGHPAANPYAAYYAQYYGQQGQQAQAGQQAGQQGGQDHSAAWAAYYAQQGQQAGAQGQQGGAQAGAQAGAGADQGEQAAQDQYAAYYAQYAQYQQQYAQQAQQAAPQQPQQ